MANDEESAFVDAMASSDDIVVLTGAGISTLSGIPDFRSPGGAYDKDFRGMRVEEILSIGFFRQHPEIFYEWCKNVWYRLDDYKPNVVHECLSLLERQGRIRAIYTQNIDMLHQRAGSRKVYELHGSPAHNRCMNCGKDFPYDDVAPVVRAGDVPHCDKCGGVLKPDIVLYGEGLDGDVLNSAFEDFSSAALCLVLGTSLTVSPAGSLPGLSVRSGHKLAIVNASDTFMDSAADFRLRDLKASFEALERRISV